MLQFFERLINPFPPRHPDQPPKGLLAFCRHYTRGTGVPLVLNTSFNLRGEPIVNTAENALNTFENSGIDTLILGDVLVDKPDV